MKKLIFILSLFISINIFAYRIPNIITNKINGVGTFRTNVILNESYLAKYEFLYLDFCQ